MKKVRYLLYIDILGFSNLVKESPEKIAPLYHEISMMNCHSDCDFETIVFSDTILISNIGMPLTESHHTGLVTFMCEFAKHLMLLLQGSGIHFRGFLTCGEFERYRLGATECFYGDALINAYKTEKAINSIGLFLDSNCARFIRTFDTAFYDDRILFVFFTQNISWLVKSASAAFPVDPILLQDCDPGILIEEILILEDIYHKMTHHPERKVRDKFVIAWSFFSQKYGVFVQRLVENDFSPRFICPEYDWEQYSAKKENFLFPSRLNPERSGYVITFSLNDGDRLEFKGPMATSVLTALKQRRFTGLCEFYEDVSNFGDENGAKEILYRVGLALGQSRTGGELEFDWHRFEKDVCDGLDLPSLGLSATFLSEISLVEGLREMSFCGAVDFEDGGPRVIVAHQDSLIESDFLRVAKRIIYWWCR
jgi:hypothetical protein